MGVAGAPRARYMQWVGGVRRRRSALCSHVRVRCRPSSVETCHHVRAPCLHVCMLLSRRACVCYSRSTCVHVTYRRVCVCRSTL